MSGLSVQQLGMIYLVPGSDDVEALRDVSFDLLSGEMLTVLGPSGCGKTTLLNILAGFLAPTAGEAIFYNAADGATNPADNAAEPADSAAERTGGERITEPGPGRAFIPQPQPHYAGGGERITEPGPARGMVFQQGALFEWMTVAENIGFGPAMRNVSKKETNDIIEHYLETVGLQGFGDKAVYELSGGMQQRVALARCLANDPGLILMDEPLGALDALTREKMQGLLLKIWEETKKSIILITHSVEEALFLGERVFVMAPRPGRVVREYRLPFAKRGLSESLRDIKVTPEFVDKREEILSMIWEMEEEIMGRK